MTPQSPSDRLSFLKVVRVVTDPSGVKMDRGGPFWTSPGHSSTLGVELVVSVRPVYLKSCVSPTLLTVVVHFVILRSGPVVWSVFSLEFCLVPEFKFLILIFENLSLYSF